MGSYKKLHQDILKGVYAPGEKLTISKLKKQLNVGQCPIREALSRLVEAGLVEKEPNKGFRVANISEKDIRETVQVICHVDQLALRLAIDHGNNQWEGNVVSALHQLSLIEKDDIVFDYYLWSDCNAAFHQALVSGCPNSFLLNIRHSLFRKLDRYTMIFMKVKMKPLSVVHQEHKKLAEMALNRNADEACRLLCHHYQSPLEKILAEFNCDPTFQLSKKELENILNIEPLASSKRKKLV